MTYYHLSYLRHRRSIAARGLIAATGEHNVRAVYLCGTLEHARHILRFTPGDRKADIWAVNVDGLILEPDPEAPFAGYWRCLDNIDRSRIALKEAWTPLPWTRGHPLLAAIEDEAPGVRSTVHGWRHAQAVATTGRALAHQVDGADEAIAIAFGLIHDVCRHYDGPDTKHGQRAARYAARLHQRGLLTLDTRQLAVLMYACTLHDKGHTTREPTVGVCWDSDRLHLGRIGLTPDPARLSTTAARTYELTEVDAEYNVANWQSLLATIRPRHAVPT